MSLLTIEDHELKIKPEVLQFKPFRTIWKRDRTKSKERALMELSYLYYMYDFRSEFAYLMDPDERHKKIVDVLFKGTSLKIDSVLLEAADMYKEAQNTVSLRLLHDARISLAKLSDYIAAIDYNERDKNNKPIHDIKKIQATFQELNRSIETIDKLEEKVKKELAEKASVRGKLEKSIFEDGYTSI